MEWVKLGGYVDIQTGKLNANAHSEYGKYPFFTCSMNNLWIDRYEYDCECVLVAGNGDLNVKYYNGKFNAYQRTYIIEVIDKDVVDSKFLYYFMSEYVEILRKKSIGGVIKYIKLGDLTNAKLPLFKTETQQKIVQVLDQAQSLINKRKQQIALLDKLAESIFYEMFGNPIKNEKRWEVKKIEEIGELKNGLNYSKSDKGYLVKNIGVGDFKNLSVIKNVEDLSLISLKAEPSEDYFLKNGDIVFVRSNGNRNLVGRNLVVFPNNHSVVFSGFCIRLRIKLKSIIPVYLNYILQVKTVKAKLLNKSRGANIQNVNQKMLASLELPVPPLSLQNQFAAKIINIKK